MEGAKGRAGSPIRSRRSRLAPLSWSSDNDHKPPRIVTPARVDTGTSPYSADPQATLIGDRPSWLKWCVRLKRSAWESPGKGQFTRGFGRVLLSYYRPMLSPQSGKLANHIDSATTGVAVLEAGRIRTLNSHVFQLEIRRRMDGRAARRAHTHFATRKVRKSHRVELLRRMRRIVAQSV
jgi:hypothetical protein